MSRRHSISRRSLLQGTAVAAGAATLGGSSLLNSAYAQTTNDKPVLVYVFFNGGFNCLFNSADSFVPAGTFGCTAGNVKDLGNGLVVDAGTFGTLDAFALSHMASIGIRHGQAADHGQAQALNWTDNNNTNYAVQLASALGGDAAIKCAVMGGQQPNGPTAAMNGVSLQRINDMGPTIAALGGANDPTIPDRDIAAKGVASSQKMSASLIAKNKTLLNSVAEGYTASVDTLTKPVRVFNLADLQSAYGIGTSTQVNNVAAKFAAAELMVEAGTNVIVIADNFNWDTHGDRDGSNVRRMITQNWITPLRTFLTRNLQRTDRNVVLAMAGDFSRSLPGSDHNVSLTSTVIGKYVKGGTDGRVSANVGLPANTPPPSGLWSYLASVLKSPTNPFGANPHNFVL